MSYPRPDNRRRGLPVLTPLLLVGALAVGISLGPQWISRWTAEMTSDGATQRPQASGEPALGAAVAPTPNMTAHPAGVLFDNFHYSGPDDPALAAHGWQTHAGKGGPGIRDTWSAEGVSFPSLATAQGGKVLQLQFHTDGTKQGTQQSQLQSTSARFFTGTLAARVYFTDKPAIGHNGDHINQTLFTISQRGASASKYSELDFEYMPNGGWGAPGPRLDTTSWRSSKQGDRATKSHRRSLKGWHTVMITAMNGVVSYSVDGRMVFLSQGKSFPRERMGIAISTWTIDLPFKGERTWNMQVNWIYCKAGQAASAAEVDRTVNGFYAHDVNYVDTITPA